MRKIWLTNTLSGKREELQTLRPGVLTMYNCGPTVYGLIHIGNLRTALAADMMLRYFRRVGYDVRYVRNYTDIDDKILDRAKKEGVAWQEIAKKYTTEVELDYAAAGMLEPTHKTKATEHVPEMIAMIERLVLRGYAYVAKGDVVYSVEKFEGYGKLSGRNLEDLEAGARVEVNAAKQNPLDFVLWKAAKPGEPSWESPWGPGRPGWHIECSAMACKWLGDQIDVHHGGEDLVFPHHENEIAQTEGATGKAPFARYWVHSAFLQINKEKMSKSLGNVFGAREFLTQFSGEFARALLLGTNHHSVLDFGPESIERTLQGLERIYEAKAEIESLEGLRAAAADPQAEAAWANFVSEADAAKTKIDECFASDFNSAGALGELFLLIRSFNRTLALPKARGTAGAVLGAQSLRSVLENDVGGILGVGLHSAAKGKADLARIRAHLRASASGAVLEAEAIEAKIAERAAAKQSKDFARADALRKELLDAGIEIKDGPTGTTWKQK